MSDEIKESVSPIVEIAQAVAQTIANPTPAILVEDLILVHKLATEAKAALAGKHAGLIPILTHLLSLA